MSIFEKIAQNKIQEAIENGEFDRLSNKGQPLHLDEYFATPEEFRVGHSVLKSANVLPAEMELLREIGQLKQRMEECQNETEKQQLCRVREEKQLQLRIILERNKRK